MLQHSMTHSPDMTYGTCVELIVVMSSPVPCQFIAEFSLALHQYYTRSMLGSAHIHNTRGGYICYIHTCEHKFQVIPIHYKKPHRRLASSTICSHKLFSPPLAYSPTYTVARPVALLTAMVSMSQWYIPDVLSLVCCRSSTLWLSNV